MLNCAGARRALHAAFTLNAGAPLGFSPWVGWDKQGSIRSPVSGHGHPFSVNMDASVDSNHNPTRTALLIPGPDNASTVRGEGITNALSSRGFTIRVVRTEEGQEGSAGLSHEALLKLTVSSASSAMVFDLGGRGGQALALACKEAGAAGLYAFRPAVGMFQKVRVGAWSFLCGWNVAPFSTVKTAERKMIYNFVFFTCNFDSYHTTVRTRTMILHRCIIRVLV